MSAPPKRDLIVLVPDTDTQEALRAILERPESLGIRGVSYDVRRHPNRDPGCRTQAVALLRPYLTSSARAIVVFDREGCSSPKEPKAIARGVEELLEQNGWKERAAVIVIEPELEAWAFGDDVALSEVFGWRVEKLREFLRTQVRFSSRGGPKPDDPKSALNQVRTHAPRARRKRRSPRLFGELGARVAVSGCQDPAFRKLRARLRAWFPPG